jgi:hypothetical protein
LTESSTDLIQDSPRKFTIPKFDKRLHEAKRNGWTVVFWLQQGMRFPWAPAGQLRCRIVDVDRFSILVKPEIAGEEWQEEIWLNKSSVVCTEVKEQ